jgi:hypothetical protein
MSWNGSQHAARQSPPPQQGDAGACQAVEGGLAATLWGAGRPPGAAFTSPPFAAAPPQHSAGPPWHQAYGQEQQQHVAAHRGAYPPAAAGAPPGARRLPLSDWTLQWGARARHAARTALMPGTAPSYLLFGLIIVMLTAVLLLLLLKPPAPAAAGAAAHAQSPPAVPPPPPRPSPAAPRPHEAQTLRLPFCVGRLLAVGDGRDPRAQAHAEQACAAEVGSAAAEAQAGAIAPYVHYRTYNVSLLGAGQAARVPSYTCCCFDRSLSVCQGFSMGGSSLYTVSGILKRDTEAFRRGGGGARSDLDSGSTWRLLLGVGSGFRFNETYCALDLHVEGGATAARLAERVDGADGGERWRPLPSSGAGRERGTALPDAPPPERKSVAHGRSDDGSQSAQAEDADDLVGRL